MVLLSCTYKESLNSMDPATICGGINPESVGVQLTNLEFRNSFLKSDGVYFDLYATVKNCSGKDMPDYTMKVQTITVDSGLTAISTDEFTLKALGRDASSTPKDFGSYYYDTTSSRSADFTLKLTSATEVQYIVTTIDISSLIPEFKISPSYLTIYDGAEPSNGDYLIDPGEKFTFVLKATNLSAAAFEGLTFSLTSESPYLAIISGSGSSMGTLAPMVDLLAPLTTTVNVSPSTPRGTQANFTATITDQHGNSWTKSFTMQVK